MHSALALSTTALTSGTHIKYTSHASHTCDAGSETAAAALDSAARAAAALALSGVWGFEMANTTAGAGAIAAAALPLLAAPCIGDVVGEKEGNIALAVEVVGVANVGLTGARVEGLGVEGVLGARMAALVEIIKWKMTGCGAVGCIMG